MTWKRMKQHNNNTVDVCCKDGEWLWNDDDNYSHDDFVVVEGMSIGQLPEIMDDIVAIIGGEVQQRKKQQQQDAATVVDTADATVALAR